MATTVRICLAAVLSVLGSLPVVAQTESIDQLIANLAKQSQDRCVTARGLKQNAEMATLVMDCYPKYLNERLDSLTKRGKFVKVAKGMYQLTA